MMMIGITETLDVLYEKQNDDERKYFWLVFRFSDDIFVFLKKHYHQMMMMMMQYLTDGFSQNKTKQSIM